MKNKITLLIFAILLGFNVKAQSLLAHFPLTANGNDTTGNGNYLTINNGVFGNDGVYFDGSYQVSYGVTNEIEGLKSMPFSISIDFKIDGTFSNGTYPVFVDGGNRLAAFTIISNGSTMKAGVFANDNAVNATSATTINPNTWYHAKLNYDRTKLSLYIDNVFAVDLPVLIVNRNGGATANAIYSQNTYNGKAFKGWWKNLKVYNGVVTDTTYTLNATLQQISTPDLVPVGNTNISGKIQNNGTTNIVSFDVTYIQNSTASAIYSVSGLNIAPGAFYSFTHNIPKNLQAGSNYIKVAISKINGGTDNNYSDDTLAKSIVARHSIDAAILSINTLKYVSKGNSDITGSIKNNSLYPLNSFDVTYNVDGGTTSPIYSVTGLNISYGSTIDFVHNIQANLAAGSHTVVVNITNVNGGTDGYLNDNKISKNVIALSSLPTKRVFAEEGTGTWCSWCPRGTVYMDSMKSKYPTTFIGIAVHGGSVPEPMKDTMYANGMIDNRFGNFPGIAVDRQASAKGVDPDVVESYFKKRIVEPTPIDVNITNIFFDPTTRRLDYTVNAVPAANMNINWNFNSVLYENDVTWNKPIDSSLYKQSNYYSGGKYGPMGGFENKSNPIPAIDMHYNFVARKIMDGFLGAAGSIPNSIVDGMTYSRKYYYMVPDSFDIDQIHIVGLVSDATTKEVLNVAESEHAISWYKLGVSDLTMDNVKLYPNPTNGMIYISVSDFLKAEIYDVYGRLIYTENSAKQMDLSSFANGTYIIKIFDQKQQVNTKRVIFNK